MDQDARIFRLEDAVSRLAEAQARTEAAVSRLAEVQARTEARVERLEARLEQVEAALSRLAEAQARTEEQLVRHGVQIEHLTAQVQALVSWQRGEADRREGERYERDIVRRALACSMADRGEPQTSRRFNAA